MPSVVLYFVVLVALTPFVGTWMHRVFTRDRIGRIEGAVYWLCRIRPNVEQTRRRYALSMLAFSAVGFAVMFVKKEFCDKPVPPEKK